MLIRRLMAIMRRHGPASPRCGSHFCRWWAVDYIGGGKSDNEVLSPTGITGRNGRLPFVRHRRDEERELKGFLSPPLHPFARGFTYSSRSMRSFRFEDCVFTRTMLLLLLLPSVFGKNRQLHTLSLSLSLSRLISSSFSYCFLFFSLVLLIFSSVDSATVLHSLFVSFLCEFKLFLDCAPRHWSRNLEDSIARVASPSSFPFCQLSRRRNCCNRDTRE